MMSAKNQETANISTHTHACFVVDSLKAQRIIMRTCKDKYGEFASMVCTIGQTCEMYNDPYHCPDFREHMVSMRTLRVETDSKQKRF